MDDTLGRLRATSDDCVKAYDAWSGDKKSEDKRQTLQEAIHELRKVASRLEIDVAVSEREQQSQKKIPIPAHRSTRPGKGEASTPILDDQGSDNGGKDSGVKVEKTRSRRRTPKKAAE